MIKKFLSLCLLTSMVAASGFAAPTKVRRTASPRSENTSTESYSSRSSSGANLLGFQFGPSIANANISVRQGAIPNSDSRTRLNIGVFYEHQFSRYFALRPELNFAQRGYSLKNRATNLTDVTADVDYSANYLEIPVMAKGQLDLDGVYPYVMTGPFMGLLIGKSQNINFSNGEEQEISLDNKMSSFEFGWNFGLGSAFSVSKDIRLEAGLRYSLGLTNAFNSTVSGNSTKLNAFQILAGMSVKI